MLFRRRDPGSGTAAPARRRFGIGRLVGERKAGGGKRRGDIAIACAGVALSFTCALFPWYIFFNQDQFGPRAMEFAGATEEAVAGGATATPLLPRGDADVDVIGMSDLRLDPDTTGSIPATFGVGDGAPDQPYPDDATPFRVLHVTAGRAMIEDDSGIWLIERGATLPDNSRVARIEQRGGEWVVVTSRDKVLTAQD